MLRHAGARILLSVGVVAAAAALAGLSTWATFTDSTSATHAVSSGIVDIDLGVAGTVHNRLDVAATDLAPGDVVQRALTLTNSSTLEMSQVTLTTTATTSSLLDTDATDGLQVTIDRCSLPWVEVDLLGVYTYTCLGTTSTVLASRPVSMVSQPLAGIALAAGSGASRLRVRVTLPTSAGNAFQSLASELSFTFTGVQRAATSR